METLPYFDAHCDTLSRCAATGESLLRAGGQCDLTRLAAYRPFGQVFAIFHDCQGLSPDACFEAASRQQALFAREKARYPERMHRAVLSVEGGELLGCRPEAVETAAAWGVRAVNLTWNHANALSGSHAQEPSRGLGGRGRAFVGELGRWGILPDVSHLSDKGFWDLAKIWDGPILASHSNARAICPHTRNLTDDQFCRIRDSGGVVGINLYTAFVGGDGSLDALLAHVDHFLALGGQGTVALGSDWDGGVTGAGGLRGVEDMGRLGAAMETRGYGAALIRAVFHDNLARLLGFPAAE